MWQLGAVPGPDSSVTAAMPHPLRVMDGEDETIVELEKIGGLDGLAREATRVANRLYSLRTGLASALHHANLLVADLDQTHRPPGSGRQAHAGGLQVAVPQRCEKLSGSVAGAVVQCPLAARHRPSPDQAWRSPKAAPCPPSSGSVPFHPFRQTGGHGLLAPCHPHPCRGDMHRRDAAALQGAIQCRWRENAAAGLIRPVSGRGVTQPLINIVSML